MSQRSGEGGFIVSPVNDSGVVHASLLCRRPSPLSCVRIIRFRHRLAGASTHLDWRATAQHSSTAAQHTAHRAHSECQAGCLTVNG